MKKLTAGSSSLEYADGSLWNISVAGEEVVRRIYLVFQDQNWTSRPFKIIKEEWDIQANKFSGKIRIVGTHDAKFFRGLIEIVGNEKGEIKFNVNGKTDEEFMRNRLGICLLHPIKDLAGRPCVLSHTDGTQEESKFPLEISPNQPFNNLVGIVHPLLNGQIAHINFKGEIFETEDHRNWSDASFKTYCTPISIPFPVRVLKGDGIEQEVMISFEGESSAQVNEILEELYFNIGEKKLSLPEIGLNLGEGEGSLSIDEHKDFNLLGINYLRLTIDNHLNAEVRAIDAIKLAESLDLPLDIALKVDEVSEIRDLFSKLGKQKARIRTLEVFSKLKKTTSQELINQARSVVSPFTIVGGGTDLYFTEINRNRECLKFIDQVNFSINPQVHSFDDRTIIQNTHTQEIIARNASKIAEGKSVSIAPITLRPRFNPNASDEKKDFSNTSLPSSVDIRQKSWLAEAWVALSLRSISQSESVKKVSYFETVGWRGLRELSSGSKDFTNFASQPNEKFPVWNFFQALKGFTHSVPTASSHPELVDILVLESERIRRLVLINLSSIVQEVNFKGLDLSAVLLTPLSVTYRDIERV